MFERYTEGARHALFFARYVLAQHAADEIEPEHLLLGLMPRLAYEGTDGQRTTSAATLLLSAGLDKEAVHRRMMPKSTRLPVSVEVPFSASDKRCLVDAEREADQMNARSITTGHLLLGLLQADGTPAAGLRLCVTRIQGLPHSRVRRHHAH